MQKQRTRNNSPQAWGKIEGIDTSQLKSGRGCKLIGWSKICDDVGQWRLELKFQGLKDALPIYIVTKRPLDDWCRALRKMKLSPALWTTADLVDLHRDDPEMAVHMSRALHKAGFESVPPGRKKVRGLIDQRTGKKMQSYVWRLSNTKLPTSLHTVAEVREQYNDQPRRRKRLAEIHVLRQTVQEKLA
jgi:hypothetical protein